MSGWVAVKTRLGDLRMPGGRDLAGPGAYEFRHSWGEKPFYIGGTCSLVKRLAEHRRSGLLTANTVGWLYPCDSTIAARRLEDALTWLKNPSVNVARRKPTAPLLAATLGRDGVESWTWYYQCGHVKADGRMMVTSSELTDVCIHGAWDGWTEHVSAVVCRSIARAEVAEFDASDQFSQVFDLLTETDGLREEVAQRGAVIREYERQVVEMDEQIRHLERLRERADWTA